MNKILLVTLFLLACLNGYSQSTKSDSLLKVLKSELARGDSYVQEKEKRIKLLRFQLLHTNSTDFNAQFGLYSKNFEEYRSFKFDSAFVYIRRMIDISGKFKEKD